MAYSYFDYAGTGTTIQTDILCVSTEHMYAYKVLSEEKSKVTLSDVALAATFTKNNAGVLCELNTAPSTKIRVIRSTPYDVLMHDFSNGAQFNADSVDEVYVQLLYLCQEIVEGKLIIDSSGIFSGTSAGGLSQNELQKQLAAQYSLGNSAGEAAGKAIGYAEGEAAGYGVGYSKGEAAGTVAGDAAGYARGYPEGEAAGYARGYPEGEAAGKAAGTASAVQSAIDAAAAANGASMADASRNADGSYSQVYLREVLGHLGYGYVNKVLFYTITKNNRSSNFVAIGSQQSAERARIAQIKEPTATKDIKEWASYATPITSEKQYLEALKLVAGVGGY